MTMVNNQHTILYVDDDQDYLDAVKAILDAAGYRMVEAHNAEEALRTFKKTSPDLILVDLMMEEIDTGTSLVTELKAHGNAAPVYLISSIGDNLNISADYGDIGVSGVFQKPVARETLLAVVDGKLNR